jgi:stage V sporulation protein D (sporulation-specific penicillin-binding protein)
LSTRMNSRRRSGFILFCLTLVLAGLVARLAYLQLITGPKLSAMAINQWMREIPVEPKRGVIYDRNGDELAISASADTVVAIPAQIEDAESTAMQLASVLSMDRERILQLITSKKAAVYIARKVDPDVAAQVRALELPGITFTEESRRFYPYENLASQVLGFAGIDSQGLYGLELKYDEYLRGKRGYLQYPTNNKGEEIPHGRPSYVPPEDGYDLYTTIDQVIQHIVERELDNAMAMHNAEGAICIVMDPHTGAILAMANRPDFNPNDFMAAVEETGSQRVWLNEAISGGFEPGSTFKVVTAAAVLQEGVTSEDTPYYCKGYEVVADRRLHNWNRTGHGSETFRQVVQRSCNPGFINVALKLGADKFLDYVERFGFGQRTGIDLPGEAVGVMFQKVGPVELATMSFGQGPSVTPIQQAVAMCSIANGGKVVQPYVMSHIADKEGNIVAENQPAVLRQAITAETAERMRDLLESVVAEGGGSNAYLPGYRVAGKTGTAQVPRPGGGYYPDKHIASFNGFAPANDPEIVIFLAIIDPKGKYGYYGAQVAAPVFRNMAEDILYYLDVKPQNDPATATSVPLEEVPSLVGLTATQALELLQDTGLNLRLEGQGDEILEQTPAPGVQVTAGTTVITYLGNEPPKKGEPVQVPNVVGLSLRDASVQLSAAGLQVQVVGSGVATSQSPAAGTTVPAGSVVTVTFQP